MSKKLLIIGKKNSSKTVFITQFYIRLQKGKSKLSLYKPVEDLSAISAAKDFLVNGEEPEPTVAGSNVNMLLPIEFDGQQLDLHYPDFGGEQINRILTTREVDKKWIDAIKESDNWIFFIRLNSINRKRDISNTKVTEHHTQGEKTDVSYATTEQSSLIELLQIFLHFKESDYHLKNSKFKLTVTLTCWDELNTSEIPRTILKDQLPLLLNFIESNWEKDKIKFIGLSALQFPLTNAENKAKYENEGSESFGYLIKETGEKITDITELISEAL
ncbi:MAG: hypothetical protein H7Z76_11915 [Methylotenera sp.]|nr:hypothetical protein [Flavobacterium sp.]